MVIKQAIAEDYSTFENHKILCACRIQEALIEIARCFATAERERTAGGFPESYYKVQKIQEWLNASYAADISGERLEEEFDGNFDYMNRIFKRVTGQTIFPVSDGSPHGTCQASDRADDDAYRGDRPGGRLPG